MTSYISRRGRKLAVAAGILALLAAGGAAIAGWKPDVASLEVQQIEVTAKPLGSFDRVPHGRTKYGALEWLGGLVLTSPSKNFGGWSGLILDASGRKLVAVSDAGAWMTADITYDGPRPAGLTNARVGPFQALDKRNLKKNRDRDAEAIALLDGNVSGGTALVAFEQNHRIGRFALTPAGLTAPQSYLKLPADALKMRRSNGFEAMTVLKGGPNRGAVLAFSERLIDKSGHHSGWLMPNGGPAQRLALTDIDGFDITDLAPLDDGGALVLERRFRWLEGVKMRVRQVSAIELVAARSTGQPIAGKVLIEADMSQEIDNMEALAVHRGAKGELILTVMSDDNFNPYLQRTLLLQFALPAPTVGSAR